MAKRKFKFKFKGIKFNKKFREAVYFVLAAVIAGSVIFHYWPKPHLVKPASSKSKAWADTANPVPRVSPAPAPVSVSRTPLPVVRPPQKPRTPILGPAITFVIDDIGHNNSYQEEWEKLGSNITYAILPNLKYSQHFARLSLKTGAEVILHLPLPSEKGTIPGPGLITTNMSEEDLMEVLTRDLSTVPYHVGVNNHMGSRGTADSRIMKLILSELKRRDLFFLDSYTSAKTVSFSVGREIGMPVLKRDIFLDNIDEPGAIREQVEKAAQQAKWHGRAIAIGHYRYNTVKVLQEQIPLLKKRGFQIVSLTDQVYAKK